MLKQVPNEPQRITKNLTVNRDGIFSYPGHERRGSFSPLGGIKGDFVPKKQYSFRPSLTYHKSNKVNLASGEAGKQIVKHNILQNQSRLNEQITCENTGTKRSCYYLLYDFLASGK
jgi:hypothetical protein